jgi:hypothetical protein
MLSARSMRRSPPLLLAFSCAVSRVQPYGE